MTSWGNEPVLRIKEGRTAWSAAGNEAVVLDLERSTYVGLNDTASFLWERLAQGTTEDAMVGDLREVYDVSEPEARQEVRNLVVDLQRRGYLETT